MRELPRKWFSNSRPLPLDENRKINLSMESEINEEKTYDPDPKISERFMGRMFDQIKMPDGGRIIRLYRWDESEFDLPRDIANHNIFRLDSHGRIVWRIKRDDGRFLNWDAADQIAKRDDPNSEGFIDPFISIGDRFFERHPLLNRGFYHPKFEIVIFDTYAPGRLLGAATNWLGYDIDPETGVATCTGEQMK